MPGINIYQTPIHEVTEDWQPLGILLDHVITDDGLEYEFFNNCHRVTESGKAWVYEGYTPNYNDRNIIDRPDEKTYIAQLVQDTDIEESKYWLNCHMILDLDTEDPYNIQTAAEDIGEHIDHLKDVTYYNKDVLDIIAGIDGGDRIMFAALFNMYFYGFHPTGQYMSGHEGDPDYELYRWPYSNRTIPRMRIWSNALTYSVNDGSRQWTSPGSGIITDWPDYPQGMYMYCPEYSMSHPGLVFECFKECTSLDEYVIRSFNEFDDYHEYRVSQNVLSCILRGNHWGLQIFADMAEHEHIADVFRVELAKYFNTENVFYDRYGYPLIEAEPNQSYLYSDRDMIEMECEYNNIWTNPNTNITYYTNRLYDEQMEESEKGEPIDTPLNYPIFVSVTGHINRPIETHNGYPIYTEIVDGDDVEFLNSTNLTITKSWNDDLCRAFRPNELDIDLYIYHNSQPYFYRTINMSAENDRINEYTWRTTISVPLYLSTDPETYIEYVLLENGIRIPDELSGNIVPGASPYMTLYDPYVDINNIIFGHASYTNQEYYVLITNSNEGLDKIYTGDVTISIHKIWANVDCSNCHQNIDGYISWGSTHNNFHMDDYHQIAIFDVPWNFINQGGINILESTIPGYYNIVRHSDNCLDWNIYNIETHPEESDHPMDPSGHGDLFYFEMDPECYDWVNFRDVVGFAVEGAWCSNGELPHNNYPLSSNTQAELYYKIVYLDDDYFPENTMVPGSEKYYDFLLTGWKRYWYLSSSEQKQNNVLKYNLDTTVADGPIVDYDSEIRSQRKKVRIYIGSNMPHNNRLSKTGGFKLVTLVKDKEDNYYRGAEWNYGPTKTSGRISAPIRCGGWLGSLYALDEVMIKNCNYNWVNCNWQITNIILNGTNPSFNDTYFLNKSEYQISSQIHTNLVFNIDSSLTYKYNIPERFALFDAEDDIHCQNTPWEYSKYNGTNHASTWGDAFDKLFKDIHNLVDASQLYIYKPYLDMQYNRTFMNSGIGFNEINPKVSHHSTPYLPYFNKQSEDPHKTFAPFKDMYRDCKNLKFVDNNALLIGENYNGELGMHYFDGMFWGSGLKNIDLSLPLDGSTPWGVCKGMFGKCRFDWVGTNLIINAVNIGGHAFRNMFKDGVVTFQTMPNVNQALNTFTFANTYFNANPWANQQIDCILPRTQLYYGVYWKMFAYSSYHTVDIKATSFNRWSFGYMFKNSTVAVIKVQHNQWYYMGDCKAHLNWVKNIYCGNIQNLNQFCFYKPKSLLKTFGPNRIPKSPKWMVYNIS